jgi:hypothetical protein
MYSLFLDVCKHKWDEISIRLVTSSSPRSRVLFQLPMLLARGGEKTEKKELFEKCV